MELDKAARIFSFVLLMFPAVVFAQTGYSMHKAGTMKVQIKNFYESPPDCGIQKNISVYEAEVVDSTSILLGRKILICVECKSDLYSTLKGTQFLVKIAGECANVQGVYNFTGYPADKLMTMQRYKVSLVVGASPK